MRGFLLLMLSGFFVHCKTLECGLKTNNGQHLKDALNSCVKDNQTLQSILEMAMSSESDSESSEEAPIIKTMSSTTTAKPNAKGRRSRRAARALKKLQNEDTKGKGKEEAPPSTEQPSTTEDNTLDTSTQATEASSEVCLLHCLLEKMEMTDSDGYPDRTKLLQGLLKNASARQLRDFLQETADECFQQTDNAGDAEDTCAYTSKLVICLAEKGKSNCSDWPVGNLPF